MIALSELLDEPEHPEIPEILKCAECNKCIPEGTPCVKYMENDTYVCAECFVKQMEDNT